MSKLSHTVLAAMTPYHDRKEPLICRSEVYVALASLSARESKQIMAAVHVY